MTQDGSKIWQPRSKAIGRRGREPVRARAMGSDAHDFGDVGRYNVQPAVASYVGLVTTPRSIL
jgi:hypothetical protein